MIRLFSTLKAALAKFACWGKPRVLAPPEPDTPASLAAQESLAAKTESRELPAERKSTPGWFTRLKHRLRVPHAATAEPPVDPDQTLIIEKPTREQLARDNEEKEEESALTPQPSWFTQLKARLRLGRKSNAPQDTSAEQLQSIDLQTDPANSRISSGIDADQDTDETQPLHDTRFKWLLFRLRSKWVWIPATSITLLVLIAGVVMSMVQSAHEKEKLQAELKTAKKKLEQKSAASVAAAKIGAPIHAAAAAPETNKSNLATEFAGESPASTNSGIDAGDCVVQNKASVVQNLKNCIEGFNSAMASSPEKPRKP